MANSKWRMTNVLLLVMMLMVAGCEVINTMPSPQPSPASGRGVPTVLPTTTLFPAAIEATSTAQAKTQVYVQLVNDQATRNAVASLQAAAVPATQTSIASTAQSVSLTAQAVSNAATQAMVVTQINSTALAATRTAEPKAQDATRVSAAYAGATATQVAAARQNQEAISDAGWGLLWAVCILMITGAVVYVILWWFVWRPSALTFEVQFYEIEGRQVAYKRQVLPSGRLEFAPLVIENVPQLRDPKLVAEEERLTKLHGEWQEAIYMAAQAASIVGSWSVSKLSNRKGALGVMTEDALKDITSLLIAEGWLMDYKSNRGVDWVEGRNGLVGLQKAMEEGTFRFALPHSTDTPPKAKPAPTVILDNATQGAQRGQGTQRTNLGVKPA